MTMQRRHQATEQRLATLGHRLTAQRVIILDALRKHRQTVTARELFDELRTDHPYLGRATVFRNLDALVDVGLAQRFERSGHVYAYASCSPDHHHHLICSRCDIATEVDEAVVVPLIERLDEAYGFSAEHSALDFYGICATCREREGAKPRSSGADGRAIVQPALTPAAHAGASPRTEREGGRLPEA